MRTEGFKGALLSALIIASLSVPMLALTNMAEAQDPWTGTAVFSLENLYAVRLEKNLDLENGSKLVVKFYDYGYTGTINENTLAVEDSYVIANEPSQNGDVIYNGMSNELKIGNFPDEENCRAFIKWDLSSLSSPTSITSATLYLDTGPWYPDDITVGAYEVDNDDWSELTLCWDNAPWDNVGPQLDNVAIITQWTLDVTSWVISQFNKDKVVSIMLKSENEDLAIGVEISSYGTMLEIIYEGTMDSFENENVIETFSPPWHVEENEIARHPEGIGVNKVRLDLTTDNTEDVISTIASFVVNRSRLITRISQIKSRWPFADDNERSNLISEISGIKAQWPFAPT
ncbi:MAG: DNRLRE domain-containing protein [Hadesarchaea archaeon]|nr:DNRLRE domain-containing protein [Hadesarchaea archaeon]